MQVGGRTTVGVFPPGPVCLGGSAVYRCSPSPGLRVYWGTGFRMSCDNRPGDYKPQIIGVMNNSFPFLECQQLQRVRRVAQPCARRLRVGHEAWPRVSVVFLHRSPILRCRRVALRPPLQTIAISMSKKTRVSPFSGRIASLKARLDGLCADQDPAYLTEALLSAFTEREAYKVYRAFLAEDETRSKALLEVFDKVCSDHMCISVKWFSVSLWFSGPYGLRPRCEDI